MPRATATPSIASSPARPSTRRNPAPASPEVATRVGATRGRKPNPSSSSTAQKPRAKNARSNKASANHTAALETLSEEAQQLQPSEPVEPNTDALNNSILSGATAVSSPDSLTDIQGLQAKGPAVVRALPDLNDDSSRLLRFLAPRNVTEESVANLIAELGTADSDAGNLLRRCETQLMDSYDQFRVSSPYIFPDLVLRALLGSEPVSEAAVWRPDDILHKANLARFLASIMTATDPTDDIPELLKHVDSNISRLFFRSLQESRSLAGESELVDETFEIALELRTQLAIGLLILNHLEGDTTNPTSLIYSVFLSDPNGPIDPAVADMKGWNTPIMQLDEVSLLEEYRERVSARCQALCDAISPSQSVDFDRLQQEFSWSSFQAQMAIWTAARVKEIESQILKQQGSDEIASALESEIQRRASPQNRSQVNNFMGNVKAFGQMARNMFGKGIIPQSSVLPRNQAADTNEDVEIIVQNIPPARSTPRRRLIDRQDNAEKVTFDESQQTQSEPVTQDNGFQSSLTASAKNRANKRRINARDATNPQTTPLTTPQKRRPYHQNAGNPGRRKRARRATEGAGPEYEAEEVEEAEEAVDEGSEEVSRSTAPPASNYASVTEDARRITTMRLQNKPTQKRRAWTTEECDALIYYIAIYGISWTTIKQNDEALHNEVLRDRDQVALKDKARNMKFDYLKAGVRLPTNFSLIALDRKLKDKLASYGIEVDG